MNKLTSVLACSAALALSACGGDSDSSGMTHYGSTTKPTTEVCSIAGKTITGVEDKSCIYKDDSAQIDITLTCNNGRVILDGKIGNSSNFQGATFTSGANVNGYILQCV